MSAESKFADESEVAFGIGRRQAVPRTDSPSVSFVGRRIAVGGVFRIGLAEASVLLAFFAYAALFIYKSSFTVDGVRYFSLFDDDMISMRYAANFAHHQGLVWNPGGERLLGFTNLLWVLYMSLFHLLPIPPAKIALCVQASGALFMGVSILFVNAIARGLFPGRRQVAVGAMLLTAFYGPLANWSLQGTEVSLLTLLVTISTWLGLRSLESDSLSLELYFALGIATLCRLDMAVFGASVLLSLALLQPLNWKRHLVIGGSVLGAFLMAQVGFNFIYYGDPLPNTYYLKMIGYPLWGRLRHGLFVALISLFPLLPLVAVALVQVRRGASRRANALLLMPVVAQLSYSVWVGGDAWEWWGGANRYIAIVMPLFFILLAAALARSTAQSSERSGMDPALMGNAARLWFAVLLAGSELLANVYHFDNNLLLANPLQTARPQSSHCNEDMVRQALLVRSLTDKDASIAVVWAGSLAYFSDRRAIDLLGKSDSRIAKEPMHAESEVARKKGFWPGHLKWDYAYSIGELRPDVVLQIWGIKAGEVPSLRAEYVALKIDGYVWWVRRGSAHFRWKQVTSFQRSALRDTAGADLISEP